MPWKGGAFSLKNELRLRKYDTQTALPNNGNVARQDFRNRLTGLYTQDINDYMGVEVYYRLELVGKNGNDYSPIEKNHHLYAGMVFKF
jgi:hypothetical protein